MNPNHLFSIKYVLQNTSQVHLPKPGVCTLGGLPPEMVSSFLTSVAQDNDCCLQKVDWP